MTEQVVLIDAGNTNTVFGCYRGDTLLGDLRLSTDRRRTADELAATVLPLLDHLGIDPTATDAILVSSVVPPLNRALAHLGERYFEKTPLFVDPELDLGMPIHYKNRAEVGADRLVNAVAARAKWGAPVVVVDFGTATTFDIVDAEGAYAGGIIAPGIGIAAEALFVKASRLYRVDIQRPAALVGDTTAAAMQSGIFYGYVGLVDGILERLRAELPELRRVVATGGLATLIADESAHIQEVDPLLTLTGLKRIHDHLRGRLG